MTTVKLGRGAIVVSEPPAGLKDGLSYFKRELGYDRARHMRTTTGHYEYLYTEDQKTGTLTTMPGFAHRIFEFLRKSGTQFKVEDLRVPLPEPDLKTACDGLRDYQLEPVLTAVKSGGGILSLPTGFGKTRCAAAIMKAYDPEQLKLRGTPMVVFSAPDKDINRKNWEALKEVLPDRDIGLVMSGAKKFSDDILVITLDSLHLINPDDVGVLIVDEVHTAGSSGRAEVLSRFHNAARWGVSATPSGRFDGGDRVIEGLFGPVVCQRTYQDAVKLGALVPIEVYWVKAPSPSVGLSYYMNYKSRDSKIKSAIISNPPYSKLVADLMLRIPESRSALCFTQWIAQMANIHAYCPDIMYAHGQTHEGLGSIQPISPKRRREIYDMMVSREIKKLFATYIYKQGVDFPALDIVVNASGGGSDIVAKQIPGRASRKADGKDRAYVVDFIHEWDRDENGKAGPLLACDFSRRRSYKDLGFTQTFVDSIDELPFLKENI